MTDLRVELQHLHPSGTVVSRWQGRLVRREGDLAHLEDEDGDLFAHLTGDMAGHLLTGTTPDPLLRLSPESLAACLEVTP
jgi:hypothetical protein